MENIQKGGDRVTSRLANLRLLNKSVVEKGYGVLLLLIGVTSSLAAFGFLPRGRARNVKPHLNKLILASRSFLSLSSCSILSVGLAAFANGKLDSDLIATSKVGIRYLGVRDLERRSVLYVEGKLGFAELCLAPVPAAK